MNDTIVRAHPRKGTRGVRAHYRIVKFRFNGGRTTRGLPTNLTLDEAREYCSRESTHGKNWFCGFEEEK